MSYNFENTNVTDDEIREYYNRMLHQSTEPRSTKRRMTVGEIRRDTFNKMCKTVLPLVLAVGVGLGSLGTSIAFKTIDNFDNNRYLGDQVHKFRTEFIAPNTHRTQDNNGYWYDYQEIAKGIAESPNQDEAIYFCYENIDSLQTGKVIDNLGYDSFMSYIQSKGFDTVEDYSKFMKKEVSLRHETAAEMDELEEMVSGHDITESIDDYSLGGK